jgi:outer membrane protein, heavy metal efflux system
VEESCASEFGLGLAWGSLAASLLLLAGCVHYVPKPVEPAQTLTSLETRTLTNEGLRAFIETNAPELVKEWPRQSWDLAGLTLVAFYYHPSLDVARAQAGVAKANIITAGGRPNPTVGVTPEYNFNPSGGATPWIATIQFDVPIETAGKRGLRISQAERLSEAARLRLGTVAWGVRSGVRAALLDLGHARQQAALLTRQLAAQERVLSALEAKLAGGAATANDLAPTRIALARTQADLADARAAAEEARARLATAIAVPARSVPVASALRTELTTDDSLTTEQTRRRALTSRPDLLAALAEYAAAESALKLEVRKQYPDIHLGTGYQFDQGENKWALGLNVELPVLNRNQGPIAEAKAKRHAAGVRVLALQASILGEVDRALAAWSGAQSRITALDAVRGAQQSRVASLKTQFDAGAVEALDVLIAEAELVADELLQQEARTKALRAFGELEDAVQRPLQPDLTLNPRLAQP